MAWVEYDIFLLIRGAPSEKPSERKLELEMGREKGGVKIGGEDGALRSSFCIALVHLTRAENYRYSVGERIA